MVSRAITAMLPTHFQCRGTRTGQWQAGNISQACPRTGRIWLSRAGAVTVALGAVIAAGLAPAWAGQAPPASQGHATVPSAGVLAKTVRLPAGIRVAHIELGGARMTVIKPDETITCTLRIDDPYETFLGGVEAVNVVGSASCSARVEELEVDMGLYFDGNMVAGGGNADDGITHIQANAATDCVDGTYQGEAGGDVIFPPNSQYAQFDDVFSSPVDITC